MRQSRKKTYIAFVILLIIIFLVLMLPGWALKLSDSHRMDRVTAVSAEYTSDNQESEAD